MNKNVLCETHTPIMHTRVQKACTPVCVSGEVIS